MQIQIMPRAYWHLQWLCHRTKNEVSCMGLLEPEGSEFKISEVILVKQEVSSVHVNLNMEWWADKQSELYEQRGIQPWQTSAWLHTHPAGVNRPSDTDEDTMCNSFGSWDFAIMIILTQEGHFYARTDFCHEFPGGKAYRFQIPCEVIVAWNKAEDAPVTPETLSLWEKEFKELVTECDSVFSDLGRSLRRKAQKTKKAQSPETEPWFENEDLFGEEVEDYAATCEQYGLDPYDPASYEAIYGVWPGPEDFAAVSAHA